jgi:hypothetical protein
MEQAMIEIHGLTPKQVALCDIMWTISSKEGVESFIRTLPQKDARDARTLIEMMQLAFLDEVDDTQIAQRVIQRLVDKR